MTAGLETFAKVRALHDGTTAPGERAAAAARMQVLARKAGLTVDEALSKLDAAKPKPPAATMEQATAGFFRDLFNSPEARAAKAARDHEFAERRRAVLERYGSEEAVWAPCERERALREACRPFIVRKPITGGEMDTLSGWSGGAGLPPGVRVAVSAALPLPGTVAGAWEEYGYWEGRYRDRESLCPDIDQPLAVRARIEILERLLDTLPAQGMRDLRARLDWMQCVLDWGISRPLEEDQACLDALRADVERMGDRLKSQPVQTGHPPAPAEGASSELRTPEQRLKSQPQPAGADPRPFDLDASPSVQTGHRPATRAERRAAAAALIAEGTSDREVARRLGISPTTVGAVRRDIGKARQ